MILRNFERRRGRSARASLLPVFAGFFAALMVSSSCRSPLPEEHVYTGRNGAPRSSGGRPNTPPKTTGAAAPAAGSAGVGGAEPPGPAVVAFTKAALLAAEADCTLGELRHFRSLAEALRDRCEEFSNTHGAEQEDAARRAFRAAMSAWQMLEVHRYGPAARKGDDPAGGQDLRDEIYAWPLGGRCNVELQLVSKGYAQPGFAAQLINVRGLGTLEYLLFNEDASNGCPSYSPLNAQGTWAALGLEELRTRKAEYARVVADDVLAHATALVAAWEGGRFREQLVAAGSAGSPYTSEQAALNAVSNALFYVEREVKDKKLALPPGISPDCTSGSCPELLESQYAGLSTENIRQNLRGFRQLFWGCGPRASGLGFDDWLNEVGAGELERRMATAFEGATLAFEQLDPPLERALLSKPEVATVAYQSLKRFTDLLKTEFVSALRLELPTGTETDND
jgi:uncharacterized protein